MGVLKSDKKERFAKEYIIDLHITNAAERAGYSQKTAYSSGHRVFKEKAVQLRIQELMAKRSKRTEITADRVLQELALMGFANMMDYISVHNDGYAYIDLSNLSREQAGAIQEATVDEYTEGQGDDSRDVKRVKIKLADKRGALTKIGEHLGMFKQIHEHSGKDGTPLNVNFYLPDNGRNDRSGS